MLIRTARYGSGLVRSVGRSDAGYVWNLGSRSPCPVSVPKEAAAPRLVLLCSSKCTGIMILEFGKNRFRLADKASDFLRCGVSGGADDSSAVVVGLFSSPRGMDTCSPWSRMRINDTAETFLSPRLLAHQLLLVEWGLWGTSLCRCCRALISFVSFSQTRFLRWYRL